MVRHCVLALLAQRAVLLWVSCAVPPILSWRHSH
jgi:hypothetical protein